MLAKVRTIKDIVDAYQELKHYEEKKLLYCSICCKYTDAVKNKQAVAFKTIKWKKLNVKKILFLKAFTI